MAAAGIPAESARAMMEATAAFSPGDAVEISGLVSAKEHNGKEGIVEEYVHEKERWAVKDVPGVIGTLKVKAANLRKISQQVPPQPQLEASEREREPEP